MKRNTLLIISSIFAITGSIALYQNCSPAKYKGTDKVKASSDTIYYWVPGAWGDCINGFQDRSFACFDAENGEATDSANCGENDGAIGATKRDCSESEYRTYIQETPTANNKVDLVLVIDDSTSMTADQEKMADRFGNFATALEENGLDWQACYTSTDVDYYNGEAINWVKGSDELDFQVLNSEREDFRQIFKDTIVFGGGNNDEQGIKAAYLLAQNQYTNESGDPLPSHECIREGAALSYILISDEDERSVGGNQSLSNTQHVAFEEGNHPEDLIAMVESTYGADKKFNFNSIVVKDDACMAEQDDQSANASPSFIGQTYMELSNLTGGYAGDICSEDYTANLRFFQEKIEYSLTEVDLGCSAKQEGLDVLLVPHIEGFQWSLDGSKISFSPIIPSNSRLVVNFICE